MEDEQYRITVIKANTWAYLALRLLNFRSHRYRGSIFDTVDQSYETTQNGTSTADITASFDHIVAVRDRLVQ